MSREAFLYCGASSGLCGSVTLCDGAIEGRLDVLLGFLGEWCATRDEDLAVAEADLLFDLADHDAIDDASVEERSRGGVQLALHHTVELLFIASLGVVFSDLHL